MNRKILTILIKEDKDNVNKMVAEVNSCNGLRNVLEGILVDWSASNMVEHKSRVDVINKLENLEECQELIESDSLNKTISHLST